VTKLLEGNDYMRRISAENEIGQGKPASLTEPVTAKLHLIVAENHVTFTVMFAGSFQL